MLGAVFFATVWLIKRQRPRVASGSKYLGRAIILLALVVSGCTQSNEGNPLKDESKNASVVLSTETKTIDLGFVRTERNLLNHDFEVQCVAGDPVRIAEISLSCCGVDTGRYQRLKNRDIAPGELFKVSVPLRTHIVGPVDNRMTIKTDGGGTLTLVLKAVIGKPPRVAATSVTVPYGDPLKATVRVSYIRGFSEAPLKLSELSELSLAPFVVDDVAFHSRPYESFPHQDGPPQIDELTLTLSHDGLPMGKHRIPVSLKFQNCPNQYTEIIDVTVNHKYRALTERIFLGTVEPNSTESFKVFFSASLANSDCVVTAEGPIRWEMAEGQRKLVCKCDVPERAGRFEGALIVRFPAEDTHPAIRVPVSGIVHTGKQDPPARL